MAQEERKLNQSDEQARRLVDITLTLMTSSGPVSSTRIRELHYPSASWESFSRMFSRDRKRLALCGVIVLRANKPPDEPLWCIDEQSSFTMGDALDPQEALILDVACSQLASDGSFPLADDLRIALAKIDRSFDRNTPIELVSHQENPVPATTLTLERCALERHAADISYVKADGQHIERRIAIYGMFSLRGREYLVGPQVLDHDKLTNNDLHTYRMDRFESAQECKRTTYSIPDDFDVRDYILLPFQLGKHRYYAHFAGPVNVLRNLIRKDTTGLRPLQKGGELILEASVSSEEDAASWSISEGLTPLEPPSLISAWKAALRRNLAR